MNSIPKVPIQKVIPLQVFWKRTALKVQYEAKVSSKENVRIRAERIVTHQIPSPPIQQVTVMKAAPMLRATEVRIASPAIQQVVRYKLDQSRQGCDQCTSDSASSFISSRASDKSHAVSHVVA